MPEPKCPSVTLLSEKERTAVVLAIDPGSAKCGLAAVRRDGQILTQEIVPTAELVNAVRALQTRFAPAALIIGDGTGSLSLFHALEAAGLALPLARVEESHTTEAARARYLAENPARGWQRLLPPSLRTPPRPVDDYVAVILAERYWQAVKQAGG